MLILIVFILGYQHLAGAQDDSFRIITRESIKSALAQDNEVLVAAHSIGKQDEFFLYSSNLDQPVQPVKCAQSIKYSLSVKGDTQSGEAFLGTLNMGLCNIGVEINNDMLETQQHTHKVYMPHVEQYLSRVGVKNGVEYRLKQLNSDVTLHSYYVVAIGHGASFAPTAMVTSRQKQQVVLLQFSMPPDCRYVANQAISFCSNLDNAFEIMATHILRSAKLDAEPH
jgi:hypothetical protein